MRRGRAKTVVPDVKPCGLDLRRYSRRPKPRQLTPHNRKVRWETFRIVRTAIRTLLWYGLPVTPDSIASMTERLALVMEGFRRIPPKTMLNNDLCLCIYDAWKTTSRKPITPSRPRIAIPRSLRKKSAAELRIMLVETQVRLAASEAGRRQAIAAQRRREGEADDGLARRIQTLATAAKTAARENAKATLEGV